MKHVWVLGIRTSLPGTCRKTPLETKFSVFEEFAAARDAMREAMRGYAFSENAMFDGDGRLIQMLRYWKGMWHPSEEECSEGWLTPQIWKQLCDALQSVFGGKDALPQGFCPHYDDAMIAVDFSENSVSVYGYDDGPDNGYEPVIRTNCFSMQEEQDYYLYLNDLFGFGTSAELYIELRRVPLT